ncbi:hypothetical protein A2U01_0094356, partial [Trifolium medium]|nr:hypothetical protein [Trifolium medium]
MNCEEPAIHVCSPDPVIRNVCRCSCVLQ